MAMSKKNYEQIAEALAYCYSSLVYGMDCEHTQQSFVGLINELCDAFHKDNPRFDINKFQKAVFGGLS